MRKIELYIASSLDSYIAGEGGSIDWLFTDEDYGYAKFYDSIDTIMVGRKTYDQSLKIDGYPYKGKRCMFLLAGLKKRKAPATWNILTWTFQALLGFYLSWLVRISGS
jgi:dihydrofolate reductase